jgi:Uma2 family endonuclease
MVQQLERTTEPNFEPDLIYPESDGKPLADNTLQFGLIVKIQGGIDALFLNDPQVFVAGDLFWYPIEGSLTCQAPDVMVAFGRPKGHRRSYKQWQEENIAPQVVFEILSHSNTPQEMQKKFNFYQNHRVEEYYSYDPERNLLKGWLRQRERLIAIELREGWVSPRLRSRFETKSGTLEIYGPDDKRFGTYVETVEWADQEARKAQQETQRADQEARKAQQETQRADQEARKAQQETQRADQEARKAQQETQRADQEARKAQQETQRADQEAQRAQQQTQRADQEAQRAQQEALARYNAIPRLLDLGLSVEQVAEALELSIEQINSTL